jgi:ribosomal 30S subunit maturation factor RimM
LTAEPSSGGLLAIGRVSRAHGLKGELRVELFFDGSDALDQVDELWLSRQPETPI